MKNQFKFLFAISAFIFLQACIGDDFIDDNIDPVLRITNAVDTIAIGTTYQLEHIYLNNIGREENINTQWTSSDESVLEVNATGLVTASSIGTATITISSVDLDQILVQSIEITISDSAPTGTSLQMSEGTIIASSFYTLEGSFSYTQTEEGIDIIFAEDYKASTALPGLYVYLSNNQNSIADAYEIGKVNVFNGAHTYEIEDVGFSDYQFLVYYCKPFNVKVGDGEL